MSYDSTKDGYAASASGASFGRSSRIVTPSDSTDLSPYAKAIVVTVAGDLAIVPVSNADATPITFTGVSVGFIPPFRVRRVMSTGTTASVVTVDG